MTYRYPWRAMLPDYARAVVGVASTATPLTLMELPGLVTVVLAFLAIIFALFGAQAALKHATRVVVSERDVRLLPMGTRLAWDSLSRLTLAYFSVRRDGRNGWMELKVQSGDRTLRIDSRLDGFTDVVRQAAAAASGACLHLEPSTVSNLVTLGIGEGIGVVAEPRLGEHG
jgi:hypothetical protein